MSMGLKNQNAFSMFKADEPFKMQSPEHTKQISFNAYSPVKKQTPEQQKLDLNPYSPAKVT